jgi:hypothetical protein
MQYTKDNGDISERYVVVVSDPRKNYLCYDVSEFKDEELKMFKHYLDSIEQYQGDTLTEFEDVTGIKISSLWRSFKPEGIEWV